MLLCFLGCNVNLVTNLIAFNSALDMCPSCQNMTLMFIDVFAHDQETLIISRHMSRLTREIIRICLLICHTCTNVSA
jgi:hypothetical protein